VIGEGDEDRIGRRSGALFDGEAEALLLVGEIQRRIGPSMEVAGAAKGLAALVSGSVLAGVMDDGDGELKAALEFPQRREERGNVLGGVLIGAMETDDGIEEEEARRSLTTSRRSSAR
jgi:hypothetical protein